MLRSLLAVVGGYLSLIIWMGLTFSLVWHLFGPGFFYQSGTTKVTWGWIGVVLPLTLLGALLAGYLGSLIAGNSKGVKALAVVMFLMFLAFAIVHLYTDDPSGLQALSSRAATDLSAFEASSEAIQPTWYNFLVAFLLPLAVLLGGGLRRTDSESKFKHI